MKKMSITELRALAAFGVGVKVGQLRAELKEYEAMARELTSQGHTHPTREPRRRRTMSATMRREVSRRMKAYWRSRRAERKSK